MAKLTRKTQKIFADSAAASQITAFGSIKANSPNPPVYSKDPDIIQSNEYMQGWSGATQDDYAPYRQDMNAIQNLVTRQLAYLFQAGIPEYDSATQYYANCSFCQYNGNLYLCIQDALNKNPSTEPTYWKLFDVSSYAPLNSPAFTGTPTAPTQLSTDNSTAIATTAFVKSVIGGYALIDSPTLTGTPKAPTPATTDNSTQIATTSYVKSNLSSYAPLASPALTGNPTAPTQTAGNNSTRLATTAFVTTAVSNANTIKTGTILPYAGSSVPTGYLQCNGAAVSRTTYSALFSAIGTTWGAGDGSTTYNLPNLTSRFLKGGTPGQYNEESLPNASGHFLLIAGASIQESSLTGVFSMPVKNATADQTGGSRVSTGPVEFNLSGSSSVYQDNARVQPNNAEVMFIIKY